MRLRDVLLIKKQVRRLPIKIDCPKNTISITTLSAFVRNTDSRHKQPEGFSDTGNGYYSIQLNVLILRCIIPVVLVHSLYSDPL